MRPHHAHKLQHLINLIKVMLSNRKPVYERNSMENNGGDYVLIHNAQKNHNGVAIVHAISINVVIIIMHCDHQLAQRFQAVQVATHKPMRIRHVNQKHHPIIVSLDVLTRKKLM